MGVPEDAPKARGILAEHSGALRQGAVVALVMHAGVVVLAGDWYLAFSAHFLTLALLGNFWRVPEGVIMAIAPLYNTVLLAVAGLWWPEA